MSSNAPTRGDEGRLFKLGPEGNGWPGGTPVGQCERRSIRLSSCSPLPPAVIFRRPCCCSLADLHLTAGDRLVFWAEAEDAYDLEQPQKGPHRTITPTYRIAVVAQEESFNEVVYKDDWSTQWYDSLKVATLTKREIPPRQSPDREPAADVAKKLLEAPQNGDSVQGADRQLVQDYFDSLNVMRKYQYLVPWASASLPR